MKRLQFDFMEQAVERLDELVLKTEKTSRADVIRNALRYYEYFVDKQKEGYEILMQKDDKMLVIPPLF